MNSLPKILSVIALLATVVPCVLYFFGSLGIDAMKWVTLAATIAWFAATPFWVGREESHSS